MFYFELHFYFITELMPFYNFLINNLQQNFASIPTDVNYVLQLTIEFCICSNTILHLFQQMSIMCYNLQQNFAYVPIEFCICSNKCQLCV